MFEKLIERILNDVLGRFIQGLDAKKLNVGIWSGTIEIKNVKLKPQLFIALGIPFIIDYSSLASIVIKIPWKSLFASHLEISIQNIYALISLTSKLPTQNQIKAMLIQKIDQSLKQMMSQFKKATQKQKKQQKKDGYLDNVYLKMIDNLDINIQNFHIRFQEKSSKCQYPFAFGVTLETITFCSVNQIGQKIFVDRTKMGSDFIIRKKLEMRNMGIYWKQRETNFLALLPNPSQINERMLQMLKNRREDYLLLINLQGLLTETYSAKSKTLYDLSLETTKLVIQIPQITLKHAYYLQSNISQFSSLFPNSNADIDTQFDAILRKYYLAISKQQTRYSMMSTEEIKKFQQGILLYSDKIILGRLKVIVSTMGLGTLSKFQSLNAFQYEKVVLLFEKIMKKQQNNSQFHLQIIIPQISLFLVSQFKQLIFEFTLKNIQNNIYFISNQQTIFKLIVKGMECFGKNNTAIVWMEDSSFKMLELSINYKEEITDIQCYIAALTLLYDVNTFQQIDRINRFVLSHQLKTRAIKELNHLGVKMQKKIQQKVKQFTVLISVDVPKLIFKQGFFTWIVYFGTLKLRKYDAATQIDIRQIKVEFLQSQASFICIPGFNIDIVLPSTKQVQVNIPNFTVNIHKTHFQSLQRLKNNLRILKKQDLCKKAEKFGYTYLKQKMWRKCQIALLSGKVYLWEVDGQYPFSVLNVRKVKRKINNNNEEILISDKSNMYELGFKQKKQIDEWQTVLTKSLIKQERHRLSSTVVKPETISEEGILFKFQLNVGFFQLELIHEQLKRQKISIKSLTIEYIKNRQEDTTEVVLGSLKIIQDNKSYIQKRDQQKPFLKLYMKNSYALQEKQIQVQVCQIKLVYKPSMILEVLNFFTNVQQEIVIKPDLQAMAYLDESKVLTKIKIKTSEIFIEFIHKKTKGLFGFGKINTLQIQMLIRYYQTSIQGFVEGVKWDDCTNYPNTTFQQDDTVVKPLSIIQDIKKQDSNRIQFQLLFLIEGSSKINNKIDKLAKVKIMNFRLNYIHEVIFRLIDYIQVQIIGVLLSPQFFEEEKNDSLGLSFDKVDPQMGYKKYVKQKQQLLRIKLLQKLGLEKVKNFLENQKPLIFQIQIQNIAIRVLSDKLESGVQLNCDKLSINNSTKVIQKNTNIGTLKYYYDIYNIKFINTSIGVLTGQQEMMKRQQCFDVDINIQYFGKEIEYVFIYGERLNIRSEMDVIIKINPIYIKLSQAAVHELNKIVKYNIGFEDGLDFMLIYDYTPFMLTSNRTISVNADMFTIELLSKNESLIIEIGNLSIKNSRINDAKSMLFTSKHFLINFGNVESHNQIATSRKNFRARSYRRTEIKQIKDEVTFGYESKQFDKLSQSKIIIKQIFFLPNIKFLNFLNALIQRQSVPLLYPQNYRKKVSIISKIFNESRIKQKIKEQMTIILQNLLFCYRVPQSYQTIFSFIMCGIVVKSSEETNVELSYVESFKSDEDQIDCENIREMRKRTIIRPLKVHYRSNAKETQINTSDGFVKCSLTDIFQFFSIITEIKSSNFFKQEKRSSDRRQSEQLSESKLAHRISEKVIGKQNKNKIQLGLLQVLIINDINLNITPLLYGKIKLKFNGQEYIKDPLSNFNMNVSIDYFNLRNSMWQPLVESSNLKIQYQGQLINISSASKVNLNCSTNFLQSTFKTLMKKQIHCTLNNIFQQFTDQSDAINSWILVNQLGYDITIKKFLPTNQSQQLEQVFIPKNSSAKITFFQSQIFRSQESNQQQQKQLFVIIHNKLKIKRLNISEIGLKKIMMSVDGQTFQIIKHTTVDISKNVKYVSLSSLKLLQNCTKKDLTVTIKQKSIILKALSIIAIPFDLVNSDITFFPDSENINISKLESMQHLIVGEDQFNIQVIKKRKTTFVRLHSPFKFKNYLPFPLIINLKKVDQIKLRNSIWLDIADKSSQEFLYEDLSNLQASFIVEDHQITEFLPIQPGVLQVFSYQRGVSFNIKIQAFDDNLTKVFIFYPQSVLYNSLKKQICLFSAHDRCLKTLKPEGIYVFSKREHLKFKLPDEPLSIIVPLLNERSQFLLKKSDQFQTLNYPCILSKNHHILTPTISFTQYKLKFKYTLINKTKYNLMIKAQNFHNCPSLILNPYKQQNLCWFSTDALMSKNKSNFLITLENGGWQWSASIIFDSYNKEKTTNFLLRNRKNFRQILYFQLKIKQKNGIFLFQLFDLVQQKIPFLIENCLEDHIVRLDDLCLNLAKNQQSYFSWENPQFESNFISITIKPVNPSLRTQTKFKINAHTSGRQHINLKYSQQILTIVKSQKLHQKIFYIQKHQQKIPIESISFLKANLDICIALINNSFSPAYHLLDFNTNLLAELSQKQDRKMYQIKLKNIQLDNQSKHQAYYPVVLTTSLDLKFCLLDSKALQIQLNADIINLKIQEDFLKDSYATLQIIQGLLAQNQSVEESISDYDDSKSIIISSFKLPELKLNVQILTKKLSIQTSIHLQKPASSSYPWQQSPYPISRIVINLLSHVSISPWAFVRSFKKGVASLLTQESSGRAVGGFFTSILGGIGNGISGLIGIIVGHDIQKVDNFIDGIDKGVIAFGKTLLQIKDAFEPQFSVLNLVKGVALTPIYLVTKPIKGVLRMAFKISQGLKKTAKFDFVILDRQRFPIVFHSTQEYFKVYQKQQSEILSILHRSCNIQLKYFYFIKYYKLRREEQDSKLLIVGSQTIIMFSYRKYRMIWDQSLDALSSSYQRKGNSLELKFYQSLQHFEKIVFESQIDLEDFLNIIDSHCKNKMQI